MSGSFRGADVGAHRHVHADVAGQTRQKRAESEADSGLPAQSHEDRYQEDNADDADRGVLTIEVSGSALLNCGSDLAHALVACGQRHDPSYRNCSVQECGHCATDCYDQTSTHLSLHLKHYSPKNENNTFALNIGWQTRTKIKALLNLHLPRRPGGPQIVKSLNFFVTARFFNRT